MTHFIVFTKWPVVKLRTKLSASCYINSKFPNYHTTVVLTRGLVFQSLFTCLLQLIAKILLPGLRASMLAWRQISGGRIFSFSEPVYIFCEDQRTLGRLGFASFSLFSYISNNVKQFDQCNIFSTYFISRSLIFPLFSLTLLCKRSTTTSRGSLLGSRKLSWTRPSLTESSYRNSTRPNTSLKR